MRNEPTPILLATQATGDVFNPISGAHIITLAGHAGGTVTLQIKFPVQVAGVDVWLDTDVQFTKNDALSIVLSSAFEYRMSGGSVGAQAFMGLVESGGI